MAQQVSRMSAREKAADALGWFAIVVGDLLGVWSVYNTATRPRLNEFDVIDLLLGVGIAFTLVVMGVRLRQGRGPWVPFFLGFTGSTSSLCWPC